MTQMPADRYGRRSTVSTRLLLVIAALAGIALVVWYVLTIGWNSTPKVTSSLGDQHLEGNSEVSFAYSVHLGKGVKPSDVRCIVSAQAKDFSVVGGPTYVTPKQDGDNTYTLPVSRHAVYINWSGCTAPGQSNPR